MPALRRPLIITECHLCYVHLGQYRYQGWEYSGQDVDEEAEDDEADRAEEEEEEAEAEVGGGGGWGGVVLAIIRSYYDNQIKHWRF